MKLGIGIFLLLTVFAITISIQVTYAQTEDEGVKDGYQSYENDEIGVNLEYQEDQLLIDDLQNVHLSYENTAIGVNLEYPANWSLIDGIQNVPFVARLWAPGNSGLISMDHMYRDSRITPEEIAESHVRMLQTKGNDLKVVESKPIIVSNHSAWQLTYSTADGQGHRLVMSEVFIIVDSSRYVFTYSVWEGFPDYLPVFDAIIDSVQIKSIDTNNLPDDSSDTFSLVYIPNWVEHNARWWNEGQIDDQTMISAIQFMADRGIIIMPSMKEIDVYKIAYRDDPHLYDTIKHSAWKWAEEADGEQYFLKGIGYLASLNSPDESSSYPKNLEDCPPSFSSRCFAGKITEVVDGDTIQVNDIEIHLALISTPKLDELERKGAKGVVERYCSDGTDALVDQDNLHQIDGFTADGPVLAVVYCNGYNIHEILLQRELGTFDNTYCHASEFADESWAKAGCSE